MKKMLAIFLITGILSNTVANAAMSVNVEKDKIDDRVDVTIDAGEEEESLPVTVKIIKEDGEDVIVSFIEMGYTDENGIFKFSYINDLHTGEFKVIAKIKDESAETTFTRLSDFEFLQVCIESAEHWTDVENVLKKYADILGISVVNVNTTVYKEMMGEKFSSYQEYTNCFNRLKNKYSNNNTSAGGGGGGISSAGSVAVPVVPGNISENNSKEKTEEHKEGNFIFTDMEDAKWAFEAVRYVYEKGIVSGTGDDRFEPNRKVTRAEAAKMLVSALGFRPDSYDMPFTDVAKDHWSYQYISAAYQAGIVSGRSNKVFDANSPVTRQELAVMAYKVLVNIKGDLQKADKAINFADMDMIASWAYEAMDDLVQNKFLVGIETVDGKIITPVDDVTRAEVATVIYNILK